MLICIWNELTERCLMVYKNNVMDGNVQLKRKWPDFVMNAKKTRTNEDQLEMDQNNSY